MQGNPVAGVGVGPFEGSGGVPIAESDASGVFELDLDGPWKRLVTISREWVTVRYSWVRAPNRDGERFLIVAAPISLAGTVTDASGRPLADAAVKVEIPFRVFARFPFALDSTGLNAFETKSDAAGSYALKRVPSVANAELVTSHGALATDIRALPSQSVSNLHIELKEVSHPGALLEGVVVHEDGKPAANARVRLVDQQATADVEGRFRLAIEPTDPDAPLVAVLKGFQPAVVPEFGRVIESTNGRPPSVRLALGPAPLSIAGRVREAEGSPKRRWTVSLFEGTVVSPYPIPVLTAENLSDRGEPRVYTSDKETFRLGGVRPYQIPVITAEQLTDGGEQRVRTSDDGSFRIGGLRNITYRLQAWNPDGETIRSQPILAGTEDAVLQAEPDAYVDKISGRVVSRDGLPLPDVVVALVVVTERTAIGSNYWTLRQKTTQKDGSFAFGHVPRHFAGLNIGGESIQQKHCDLDEVDLSRPIELVATRMVRFRFESEARGGAPTWIEVLDAEGKKLDLVTMEVGRMYSMEAAPLTEGNSHVLSVSEDVFRLVLHRGDQVLSSQPLRLSPNEVTVVRRER